MKEIVISTQADFDALPEKFDEYTRIIIKNTKIRIVVVARENSSVEARGNSSVEAWGNSSVVARENSSVEARGNSSVEAWGNSSVVARENVVVRAFSNFSKIVLFGFSVAIVIPSIQVKIEKKSEHAYIQHVQEQGWFERNGVEKTPTVILYKRVSHDLKTQENTKNETVWTIGSKLTHPKWNPSSEECGEGKFHACSKPYFCDEFRSTKGDRYIALSVKLDDTFAWEVEPQYKYKIALREAKVLYECDRFGKEIAQ